MPGHPKHVTGVGVDEITAFHLLVTVDEIAALVRRETGIEEWMKEPYVEGVATHDGPQSCVVVRKGGGEALTGYAQARY